MIGDYAPPRTEVYYPDSDGQPMAESDLHRDITIYAVESLESHFRAREDVYVSGNLFVYYERGNAESVVAPDVFVVVGTDLVSNPHQLRAMFGGDGGQRPDCPLARIVGRIEPRAVQKGEEIRPLMDQMLSQPAVGRIVIRAR